MWGGRQGERDVRKVGVHGEEEPGVLGKSWIQIVQTRPGLFHEGPIFNSLLLIVE